MEIEQGDVADMSSVPRQAQAFVFIHGIHDFRFLKHVWPGYRYFRQVRQALADLHGAVHFPRLPNGEAICNRATALAAFLDQLPQPELFLIAHSTGGLDARHVIHKLDPDKRVRALVTIATPHRGTTLATWLQHGRGIYPWLARHLLMPGLHDLTPEACERFNNDNPDRKDVRYISYVGCRPVSEMPWGMRRATKILQAAEGDNDGVVSEYSATWGSSVHKVRADHLELVGWSLRLPDRSTARPFDHRAMYRSIVSAVLKEHGT